MIWKNPNMSAFGVRLEKIMNGWVDAVKGIRKHVNFMIPKDADHIL